MLSLDTQNLSFIFHICPLVAGKLSLTSNQNEKLFNKNPCKFHQSNPYTIQNIKHFIELHTKGYKLLGELTNEDEIICYKENVMIVRVKNINKLDKEDTYNMEVEETHNFIANGMVVHNSIDASRYLLKEWVDTGRCPEV